MSWLNKSCFKHRTWEAIVILDRKRYRWSNHLITIYVVLVDK